MRVSLLFAVAGLILCCASSHGTLVGGWKTIDNLADPYVQRAAQYAVSRLSQLAGEGRSLVGVVGGKVQVVAGLNYQLTLALAGCTGDDKCSDHVELWQAVVWAKPTNPPEYQLTDIKQLPHSPYNT